MLEVNKAKIVHIYLTTGEVKKGKIGDIYLAAGGNGWGWGGGGDLTVLTARPGPSVGTATVEGAEGLHTGATVTTGTAGTLKLIYIKK